MDSTNRTSRIITIAHLTTDSKMGGTEHMILDVAASLDKTKFRSIVITLLGEGELEQRCKQHDIFYHSVNMKSKFDFFSLGRLKKILRSLNIDILHSYLFHANILGRFFGKKVGIPVIISGQRNVDLWRRWYHNMLDRLTARYCQLFISNSEAGKKMLIEKVNVPENRISVIHNGIDVDAYADCALRKNLSAPIKLLTIGSLTQKKGQVHLLDAVAGLKKNGLHCVLTILGEGPLSIDLPKKAVQLSIQEIVHFEGFKSNVADYLAQTDIFILPSLWEGLPVSLMQAMACGIPCVATRIGGVCELINEGKNGVLVKQANSTQLAEAVLALAKNDDLRYTLGQNARKTIGENFSRQTMIEKLNHVYATIYRECSGRK